MQLVLDRAARIHAAAEEGPPPCVPRRVTSATFAGRRAARVAEGRKSKAVRPPEASSPTARIVLRPEDVALSLSHPAWRKLAEEGRGYFEFAGPLAASEMRVFDEAEDMLRAGPDPPRLVRRIDPAWLRAPLALCTGDPRRPRLNVAAPAILRDLAFVDVDFDCVLCGQGVLLALRRTDQGWAIVAGAQEWVS